ncbi:right-handed parallel beta-helix repeat-containing protein [Candidatus Woesearchaeota archaeon]|nr:right-handed parallel beta-helix repeat-containing protein [Candidatus Woesearchaeota archaeon]MBT5396594.1 right-handed parallel beta-helix repeat-containing protein [Candidatus Woesearchaeota archaeon]MBT6367988.1 right-handed parallel beta-helix repeat-containing protein [Candidatus Woesearchaeota archaeon]MBT7762240.1 right-handed parallel beta-helix repeat-containing protein [Candidatus Woesearchaeota archaeon]
MKKKGVCLFLLILLVLLIGCAQEDIYDEELANELDQLSDEELNYVLAEDIDTPNLSGEASLKKYKKLEAIRNNPKIQRFRKEPINCKDSDGGANYQESGYVSLLNYPGGEIEKSDFCWKDGVRLQEYVCEKGKYKGDHTYDCSKEGGACNDGACTVSHCYDHQYNAGEQGLDCGWSCQTGCEFVEKEGTLWRDETWKGNVLIIDGVEVPEGITLTIEPGTIVKFAYGRGYRNVNRSGLNIIGGKLIAKGTQTEPIWFTSSAPDPINGDWHGVNIRNSLLDNVLDYVIIEYAQLDLSLWDSSATVTNSIIRWSNSEGVYLERSTANIDHNLIYSNAYNGIALEQYNYDVRITNNYFYDGHNPIHGEASELRVENNLISNNWFGATFDDNSDVVFNSNKVEGSSRYALHFIVNSEAEVQNNIINNNNGGIECADSVCSINDNAIFNNQVFNFRVTGDSNIDLKNNWWGTTSLDSIFDSIDSEVNLLIEPIQNTNEVSFQAPNFIQQDLKNFEINYIPGEEDDLYLYVYPSEDETRRVLHRVGEGLGFGWTLLWVEDYLWKPLGAGDTIAKLDPKSGEILETFVVEGLAQPHGMAFDGTFFWINDFTNKVIFKVNYETKEIVDTITIPNMGDSSGASSIAYDGEYLYLKSWTTNLLYKINNVGDILETIELPEGGGSALTWDGNHFWIEGCKGLCKVSRNGQLVGEIYPVALGAWALAWEPSNNENSGFLWSVQRTSEMWDDDKIFKIEILDDSFDSSQETYHCLGFEEYVVPPTERVCCSGLVATECTQFCPSEFCCDPGEMICLEE